MARPHHLMVDLQRRPVGVDPGRARFSWRLPAVITEQHAFQLQIGADPEACSRGDALWDSGRRPESASTAVACSGLGLAASTPYWWRVRVWSADAGDPGPWSDPVRMITAIASPWSAETLWVGADEPAAELPRWALLRHEFDLPAGEILAAMVEAIGDDPAPARQYVAKLWCNDIVIGRASVRPVADEVRYHTFDVTGVVIAGGRNALAAQCWAEQGQRFAARLIVTYADGRRVSVETSGDWQALDGAAVLPGSATLEGGWYRAPLENWTRPATLAGWTGPGYNGVEWSRGLLRPPVESPAPAVATIEQSLVSPQSVQQVGPGRWLVDLGRLLVGGLRVSVVAQDGDQVRVVLGEELEGSGVRSPLRGGNVYDETWTLSTGHQDIEHWGYRGFRYAELITSAKINFTDCIRAVALHSSDLETEATFACSDPDLVRVWDLCRDTIEATALDLYQDTPTRERGPYEGDQYVNQLGQYAIGGGYALARYSLNYLTHHPTWPTEYRLLSCLCAWEDYLITGDPSELAAGYDLWLEHNLEGHLNESGLVEKDRGAAGDGLVRDIVDWPVANLDGYEFSRINTVVNAFQSVAFLTLSRMAGVIGRSSDEARLAELAESVRTSLNAHLLDHERAAYRDGLGSTHYAQHATAIPTALGLAPTEARSRLGDTLAGQGIRTSIYAVQFLLDALYETGHAEAAVGLMTRSEMPGWIDTMDRLGATITPEAWDPSMKANMSMCHAWGTAPINVINRHLIGLRILQPGASKVLIRPQPGGLSWFEAGVPTLKGPITVRWDTRAGEASCTIDLPGNMTAELDLPGGRRSISSGRTTINLPDVSS